MANERIGTAPCPLCRQPAGVTVSKAGLTVLTCNRCHCQLFSRSDSSDGLLREMLTPIKRPEPEKPAGPVDQDPAPAAPPPVETKQQTPPPAAPAAPKKSAWDLY